MANIHGVIRTDLMSGTAQPADLVSVRYMGASDAAAATAIDNGNVVLLSGLAANEREVWTGYTPAANSALGDIVVIATPETMYDERKKNLEDFENEAGKISRGYRLRSKNIFSVTTAALNIGEGVEPAKGYIVELMAGTKLNVAQSLTADSTKVGEIIDIETAGRYTFYVIQVA